MEKQSQKVEEKMGTSLQMVRVMKKKVTTEKIDKSGDFKVTHQAPAKRWSLFSHMVSFVASILFSGPWCYSEVIF